MSRTTRKNRQTRRLEATRKRLNEVEARAARLQQTLDSLRPMADKEMPQTREWEHWEWACNQWYLATLDATQGSWIRETTSHPPLSNQ